MNPRVKKVTPMSDYKLMIVFSDNKKKIFSMRPYLRKGIFSELSDIRYFNKVKSFMGSIAWPHGQDVCPDTLYLSSK